MKAITVIEPGRMEMLDVEKPQITEPDQVLVHVKDTGICGSDVHIFHGSNPYATYPRVIGHEASGVVEEVGSAVTDLKPGDAVVFEPIQYCGKCYACRHGHHNVCRDLKVLGCSFDGTFREYAVVPASEVYKYDPEKMSFVQAAACEPYTIGLQANWRADTQPDDLVLVHGAGPIGLIVADVAKSKGAKVIISEPNDYRLGLAKEIGIDYTVNPNDTDLAAFIDDMTDGEGVNVVFETAGVPALMAQAVEVLSPAGRFVPLTFGSEPIPVNFQLINAKELTILGTRHQYQKFPEVVDFLPTNLDHVDKIITDVIPADDFQKAFDLLAEKGTKAIKVQLSFE